MVESDGMNEQAQSEYDIVEAMDEHVFQETTLNVFSTADLLREKHAFITGATNHNCPILTFPDNPQTELTQEKYHKLVSYLTQVPSEKLYRGESKLD